MRVVSDKPLRVASLKGPIVLLEPGVPKDLDEEMAVIALGEGAKIAESSPPLMEVEEIETIIVEEPVADDRQERLIAVMRDILEEGNPSDFTAMNTPKAVVVNRKFGDTVLTDEREAAWKVVSED